MTRSGGVLCFRVSASAEKSHTPVDANMKRAAADDAADSVKQATAASEALTLRDAEAAGAAVDPERPDQETPTLVSEATRRETDGQSAWNVLRQAVRSERQLAMLSDLETKKQSAAAAGNWSLLRRHVHVERGLLLYSDSKDGTGTVVGEQAPDKSSRKRPAIDEPGLRAVFRRMDQHRDGRVSHGELIHALRTDPELRDLLSLPSRVEDSEQNAFEAAFREMEAAGDGTSDADARNYFEIDAFVRYVTAHCRLGFGPVVENDGENRNKRVDSNEAAANDSARAAPASLLLPDVEAEIMALVADADSNGDGYVDYTEFIEMVGGEARECAVCVRLSWSKLALIGGRDCRGTPLRSAVVYDTEAPQPWRPATDSELPPLRRGRWDAGGCALPDGRLLQRPGLHRPPHGPVEVLSDHDHRL